MATPIFNELLQGLKDDNPAIRDQSARELGRFARRASIPALIQALGDDAIAAEAADSLGRVAVRLRHLAPDLAAQAVGPLLDLLKAGENWVARGFAATALGVLGLAGEEVVPALCRVMEGVDPEDEGFLRWSAAEALGRFRAQALPAIPLLLAALRDPDAEIRYVSAEALGKIGSRDPRVMRALEKAALWDDNEDVREWAAFALDDLEQG